MSKVSLDFVIIIDAVELESKVVGLSTVIHGLLHFTNYSVQVAAVTSAGDGKNAKTILPSIPLFNDFHNMPHAMI